VNPAKVVLGLGWYGRSFTLASPSCNKPWCHFESGGHAGECTGESGILSNAEISRIRKRTRVPASFDRTAAVKWIHWDSNQWVSFDDGETMKMKVDYANKRVSKMKNTTTRRG
jgi:chitinase